MSPIYCVGVLHLGLGCAGNNGVRKWTMICKFLFRMYLDELLWCLFFPFFPVDFSVEEGG